MSPQPRDARLNTIDTQRTRDSTAFALAPPGLPRSARRRRWDAVPLLVTAMLVLLFGVADASAQAASTPAVNDEIDQLLSALGSSKCQFNRNGTWHSAEEATRHLSRKRDYLAKKGLVTTTESLIALAASKSSLSGTPYQVRCPGAPTVKSSVWLTRQLAELRARGR